MCIFVILMLYSSSQPLSFYCSISSLLSCVILPFYFSLPFITSVAHLKLILFIDHIVSDFIVSHLFVPSFLPIFPGCSYLSPLHAIFGKQCIFSSPHIFIAWFYIRMNFPDFISTIPTLDFNFYF